MRKNLLAVVVVSIWISLSEFFRNELLFKNYWTTHYENMGITFPSESINGIVWGIWSLVFAYIIFVLLQKFTQGRTVWIAWVAGFILMWLVVGNMGVLPYKILLFAVPLSLLEVWVSVFLYRKIFKL
jgi:hypothetical protein